MASPEERSESGRGIPAPFHERFPVYDLGYVFLSNDAEG